MIKFNTIKVIKAEKGHGGKNLVKRDKSEFIFRLRSAYKKDSIGQANYKQLMSVAKFKGIENRTNGENGVVYLGDRVKIMADLDKQIASAKGEQLEALKQQKEYLAQFDGTKHWDISAKDFEIQDNLDMLLDLNNNGVL